MRIPAKVLLAACLLYAALPSLVRAQDHLLLTEVVLAPADAEFVEIYNPTNATVSLDRYHLADNGAYATVPAGAPAVDAGDFIVRFPAGATIAPGQVIVVAMTGTGFAVTYGRAADLEVISTSATVPDMVVVSTNSTLALTNAGECIALFYWDGLADLVKDVDLMNVGVPTAANRMRGKSLVQVDGPDADALGTSYLSDLLTLPLQASAPASFLSTKRIAGETGQELQIAGNGITGHDETTENITITWDQAFTSPTPGVAVPVTDVPGPPPASAVRWSAPSPVVGRLLLRLDDGWRGQSPLVQVWSVTGQRRFAATLAAPTAGTQAIGPALEPGVYFVTLDLAERAESRKVVVLGP